MFHLLKSKTRIAITALTMLMFFMPHSLQASEVLQSEILNIYQQELGDAFECPEQGRDIVRLCSNQLRNNKSGPFILSPDNAKATVVLWHGLSDSPFFVSAIAQSLYQDGYEVIAPLIPAHGLTFPDQSMQSENLKQIWYEHLDAIMDAVLQNRETVFIGGYSTGGTLSARYALMHNDKIAGLLLFSGALELPSAAHTLASVWGMKRLAKWMDGDYLSDGPHPYKYPKMTLYGAMLLLEIIDDIQAGLEDGSLSGPMPIFSAHSLADKVTMFEGVDKLLASVEGKHMQYKIDEEFDVCHGDLVMNTIGLIDLKFDRSRVNTAERCKVPKANPQFTNMMTVASLFLSQQLN